MNIHQQWREQGYLVLRQAFDAQRIAVLHETVESALQQWQQSPPENEPGQYGYGPDAWVMLHLNHARYYHDHPERLAVLLQSVADPLVLPILREVLGEEPLLLQINAYINPPGNSRIGAWHRDCQFYSEDNDEQREREILREEADHPRELHMHIPLVTTQASEVVPGSHRRPDTDAESQIRRHDSQSDAMPGALQLKLEPGDLAFFHVNALHRGNYFQEVPRRTIAVTYGRTSAPRQPTAEWMKAWNGYVASYQPWFLQPGYLDDLDDEARAFYQRFIEMYSPNWTPELLVPLSAGRREYYSQF